MKFRILCSIVCMLILFLIGCSSQENVEIEYVAMEVGSYDSMDGGIHTSEFSLWSSDKLNYYYDHAAPKFASVTFNGVTYSGEYHKSRVIMPNLYVSHQYRGDKVTFSINGNTGELCSIIFSNTFEMASSVSEDDCKQLADSIIDDYISLEDYDVSVDIIEYYTNCLYSFEYNRKINGLRTSDSISIAIDGNGNISSFGMNMLGTFDNIESVIFDGEKAQMSIHGKLENIYKDNTKRKGYDIKDMLLVKLPDGSYGVLYTISNSFEDDVDSHGEKGVWRSSVQLLVAAQAKTRVNTGKLDTQ